MKLDDLCSYLNKNSVSFDRNVPLSSKTWIKTGGTCACWIIPESLDQLVEVCKYLYAQNAVFELVGQTSNLFFHSTCNPEVVVSTVRVDDYSISDEIITCDCGVSVIKLAKDCMERGFAGFAGLIGLPGTVASSIYGNAGCFDCSIAALLLSVDVLLPDGSIRTFKQEELQFSPRNSAFKNGKINGVILSAKLRAEVAQDIQEEKRKAEKNAQYRKNHQEGYALNLGSIYSKRVKRKNVKNIAASAICTILAKLHLVKERNKLYKNLLLSWYGFQDLKPYVSDKTINTFVWKDNKAEDMFERYKQFMQKIHSSLVIEIEEKI